MKHRLIGAFVVVGVLASGVPSATAATPRATNVYSSTIAPAYVTVRATNPLSGDTRKIQVDSNLIPASLEEGPGVWTAPSGAQPAASGGNAACWNYSKPAVEKDRAGFELWRLTLSRRWCGTYGPPYLLQITSADPGTAQPNIKGIGGAWSWKGGVPSNTDLTGHYYYSEGGFGSRSGNAEWVTGEFQLCVSLGPLGTYCLQTVYPHIWVNAHFDGAVVSGVDNAGTEK